MALPDSRATWQHRAVLAYAVVDDSLSPTSPLGDAVDTFIQREDAEGFIAEVRGDESGASSPVAPPLEVPVKEKLCCQFRRRLLVGARL